MFVCASCFQDNELITFIQSTSTASGHCEYCQQEDRTLINFEEISDFFSEYFNVFVPDENGLQLVDLIDKDWKLFSGADKGEKLLGDILTKLQIETTPQISTAYTDEIVECTSYWEKLREELKWTRRFLTDVENIMELGWDAFFNKKIQLEDDILFRARIHRKDGEEAFGIGEMGCPDKTLATSGRANPQGIPYLYLSKSYETTFYETRGAYLDDISIGKFRVKDGQVVVLVDFTEELRAFANIGNILEYTKSILLKKNISGDLSKPLRRYDSELEYIPTQFICEFIRYITGADGIIFNSSLHVGGKNIVLFDEDKMECFEVDKFQINHVEITGIKM